MQRSAANQRTINVRAGKQRIGILCIHTAAVKDRGGVGFDPSSELTSCLIMACISFA